MKALTRHAVSVLLCGLAVACSAQDQQFEEVTNTTAQALTGPVQISIKLPLGPAIGDVAVGASAVALKLGDRVQLISDLGAATITSSATGRTTVGNDAKTRSVVSAGLVQLLDRATVTGNLTTAVTPSISPSARVTGTTSIQSLSPAQVLTWNADFPTTTLGDVRLEPGQQRTISPGHYSVLSIKSRAKLTMAPGTYYVDSLDVLEPQAIINVTGPVVLYAATAQAHRGQITSTVAGTPPFMLVHLGSTTFTVDSAFAGHIVAPQARLILGASGQQHTGSFFARDIEVYPDVKIRHQPLNVDFDGDGLSFSDEISIYGTNPFVADTDADGLADGDEVTYWKSRTDGISWNSDVDRAGSLNRSGDGVINLLDPDSDNDGLLDGVEVVGWPLAVTGSSSTAAAAVTVTVTADPAKADTDGDGLTDKLEHDGWNLDLRGTTKHVQSHTLLVDTDGDAVDDSAEKFRYKSDPASGFTFGTSYPDAQRARAIDEIGVSSLDPPCPMTANGDMEYVFMYDFWEKFIFADPTNTYLSRLDVYLPDTLKGKPFHIYLRAEDVSGGTSTTDTFSNISLKTPTATDPVVIAPGPVTGGYDIPVVPGANDYGTYVATAQFTVANGHAYHAWAETDDTHERVPLNWEDGPVQVQLRLGFHTDGSGPVYLRGSTYGAATAGAESYVDNVKLGPAGGTTKLLYRRSFDGGDLDFPLGNLAAGNYTLEMEWHYSGPPAKQWTHICQHGAPWNSKVQIAYDWTAHTKEYQAWKTGVAPSEAIVRRGTSFNVLVEDPSISDTMNPSFNVVRNGSSLGNWNATRVVSYTTEDAVPLHRQTWKLTVPASEAAGGGYQVQVINPSGSGQIGTANVALIFNPYELRDAGLITTDQLRSYVYDEGAAADRTPWGRDLLGYWANGTWHLNATSDAVSNLALGCIDGKTSVADSVDKIRQIANALVVGDWNNPYPTVYWGLGSSISDALTTSGATRAQAISGAVPANLTGECFDFAGIAAALTRSAGIPARMIYASSPYKPIGLADNGRCDAGDNPGPTNDDTKRWGYHVWDEVFLTDTSSTGDHWWVVDATDCAGTLTGGRSTRPEYGTKWSPRSVCAEGSTSDGIRIPVHTDYGTSASSSCF